MYRRILVPVDGSSTSTAGLDEAIRLAKNQHARLRLVHVVDEYVAYQSYDMSGAALYYAGDLIDSLRESGRKMVDKAAARVRKHGITAEAAIFENVAGRVADFIIAEAGKWRADLIVMGTHGRRGMNRLVLGSDAEIVVRTAPVPVLLVKSAAPGARARRKKAI
jgi:nucleotide-binding universal stress UspA family protein